MPSILREGLEIMLRRINREIMSIEVRLQRMAHKLGVSSWEELEKLFAMRGVDNPELDMLWPEYLYLRKRLEELRKRRDEILRSLERL